MLFTQKNPCMGSPKPLRVLGVTIKGVICTKKRPSTAVTTKIFNQSGDEETLCIILMHIIAKNKAATTNITFISGIITTIYLPLTHAIF